MGINTITESFTNSTPIFIPEEETSGSGPASPYPSIIPVEMPGTILKVTVTLRGLTHSHPGDLVMLLVAPSEDNAMIMRSAGSSFNIVNTTITFDDDAADPLPEFNKIESGTFQPTDYGREKGEESGGANPVPPAPVPSTNSQLSIFDGQSPNGNWKLYVYDQFGDDIGVMVFGWSLTITTTVI
ncbi:hypothetical protein [Salipaludibacillus aurantiacus]|uniref:P/Homo B domain-containing protein n=1 Tax=Salipaludibacillus aurantiacus TaxID=1601833 RepID=A0A1H9USV4_9BACI|nr:hypothetical protein [Salipaludibacillus aurantiacus]SES12103.1 hypothetical protein SAMN05518684_108129 [Salipaludibacillus aurantiacus]